MTTTQASTAQTALSWRQVGRGESRWPTVAAVAVAVGLQVALPGRFAPGHRLVPGLELALLIGTLIGHPGRISGQSRWLRPVTLVLVAMITVSNAWSLVRLVQQIVNGQQDDGYLLLMFGAAIWATNVIVFALWCWEFDRGGPLARATACVYRHLVACARGQLVKLWKASRAA